MICHGNICRSTMAEFVLKDMVKNMGLSNSYLIKSSATSREAIGSDTHSGTKRKLKEMQIPFTKRKAVQVTKRDYNTYDYLLCMDRNNINNLIKITGGDPDNKIHLLTEFTGNTRNIADPWYTNNFDETFDDINESCIAFLKHTKNQIVNK